LCRGDAPPGGRRWCQERQQHPDREQDHGKSTRHRNRRDEDSVIPEVFGQAQALTLLSDRPLDVLTASVTATGTEGWVSAQDQLAGLSANAAHRTVHSSRAGLLKDASPTSASVHATTELITPVRIHVPLPGR
jgi:hypothetical protein